MKRSLRALLLLACLVITTPLFAHQDMWIWVSPWGHMDGLPERYEPAALHVASTKAPGAAPSVSHVAVQLGPHRIVLPACFAAALPSAHLGDIAVSASWYHEPLADLPYYLSLSFYDRGKSLESRLTHSPRVHLLLALDTGKVLDVFPAPLDNCVANGALISPSIKPAVVIRFWFLPLWSSVAVVSLLSALATVAILGVTRMRRKWLVAVATPFLVTLVAYGLPYWIIAPASIVDYLDWRPLVRYSILWGGVSLAACLLVVTTASVINAVRKLRAP
jgi:hypothetical protein